MKHMTYPNLAAVGGDPEKMFTPWANALEAFAQRSDITIVLNLRAIMAGFISDNLANARSVAADADGEDPTEFIRDYLAEIWKMDNECGKREWLPREQAEFNTIFYKIFNNQ